MKSALFVDFDNVYSGLRKLDPALADRFARQPLRWIDWLLDELPPPEHAPEAARRRLLVRRVYLNPQVYQRYRPSFNHAGFEIIDCPPMTSEGKTSTDIHMVLDMVDLLQHQVHVDEFIVFSADADFTPVLRKLRRWDRRTTVLAVGFPSAAYRASADLLIDQDQFMRALGQRENDEPAADAATVATAGGPADAVEVMGGAVPVTPTASAASAPQAASPFDLDEIARRLSHTVADSPLPIPCARLATLLMAAHPGISPDWCGQGGFRRFMEALSLAPLRLDWSASGGHLYDPARHVLPPSTRARGEADSAAWDSAPALRALARQVHDATGVPLLSPRDFRALFEAIVAEVSGQPFQLSETGKRVRDRCRDSGHEVSRESVNWVLRGLLLGGHEFGQGHDDVQTLSGRLVGNLVNLCRREQVLLDEHAPGALQHWMLGGAGAVTGMPEADGDAGRAAESAAADAAAPDQPAVSSSARPSASATSMPSTPADMMPPA